MNTNTLRRLNWLWKHRHTHDGDDDCCAQIGELRLQIDTVADIRQHTEGTPGSLSATTRSSTGLGTTGDWLPPENLGVGDRMYMSIMLMDTPTTFSSVPAGWDLVFSEDEAFDGIHCRQWTRVVDGTETDTTFTVADSVTWVMVSHGRNGPTGTPEAATVSTDTPTVDGEVEPNPITPSVPGLYAVDVIVMSNANSPSPDNDGAAPAGYDFVNYAAVGGAGRQPRVYVAQGAFQITTSEDPGFVGWSSGGSFTRYRTFTVATRLETGTPAVAGGDHTHIEADVTNLDHWTEADHDALDHTGLTGVGGGSGVEVKKAGTTIGTRSAINFIEGTDITLTVTDDAGNDEVDVTVTSTATGGGSSSVPEWMELLAAPGAAHANDQEFTGTIGGTAVTPTGTVTWTQSRGLLSAKFDTQTSGDHCPRLYALTPSAAPVTIETRMRIMARASSNPMLGLCFTDGTTASSNAVAVGPYVTTATPILGRWAGTLTAMTTTNIITPTSGGLLDGWIYYRMVWTAANTWAWAISPDGVSWTDYGSATFAATLTPTHFGVYVSSWSITYPLVASFEYLRVTESDLSV